MKTSQIWQSQVFMTIDEASGWLARDYYANDVEGVVMDLQSIIEWAEDRLVEYQNFLDKSPQVVVG